MCSSPFSRLLPLLILAISALPSFAQAFPPLPRQAESFVLPHKAEPDVSPFKPRRTGVSPRPYSISIGLVSQQKSNAETRFNRRPGVPHQIGFGREVSPLSNPEDMASRLPWQMTPPGGMIAAVSIASPQASGVRMGVLVQRLPAEATLRFYSQGTELSYDISGKEVLDILKRNLDAGDSGNEARTYWSPLVVGEEVTLEIELPPGVPPSSVEVAIPRVSHLFSLPLAAQAGYVSKIGESDSCEVDVSCYSAWSAESNAVAKMTFVESGGSYVCSGTLLNDKDSSGIPYFLSANHCISKQTVASTLQTYWFYHSSSCNSGTLNSNYKTLAGGAILLYASSVTDTSFMRLSGTPPSGALFAGWSASAPTLGASVTAIHHPKGDLQKISLGSLLSFQNCTTSMYDVFSCSDTNQANGEYLNISFTTGVTEGGSSGSGLFLSSGSNRYLVGQLRGGDSTCSSPGTEAYGRFDIAYAASLHQWLDAGSAYSLSVSKSGNGSGTISSTPSGISCGTACSAPFASGTSVTLTATASPGSSFAGWSGACSGTSSTCSVIMSAANSVTASFSTVNISLGAALDNTGFVWTTGGSLPFIPETTTAYYGGSAVQSGAIGNSQSSYLSTNISGPGMLSFYWSVSSEKDYDIFGVYLDGVRKYYWSGQGSWYYSTLDIPSGTHTVKWEYAKDSGLISGQDAAWIDKVVFLPSGNSPYLGLWWNADESGWGMSVTQHSSMIFVAMYTYDQNGQPTWYVMSSCPVSGNSCSGDIYKVTGGTPPTVPWNGTGKVVSTVGTGTLTFADTANGTFAYTLNGVSSSKSIARQVFTSGSTAPAVDYTDLWWNASESGWGVALTQQYNIIFATWYGYDASGNPIWYVASNCAVSGSGCTGDLYHVSGGTPLTTAWNGANKVTTKVGTISFAFTNANNGTMNYSINGATGSRTVTRQSF